MVLVLSPNALVTAVLSKIEERFKGLVGSSAGMRSELLRGLSGATGAKLVNLMLAFVSSVLLARNLGPESYGAYAFIMSVISSLALLSYLGVPTLLTREIAKYEQSHKWGLIRGLLRKSNQLVTCVSILLMMLVAMVGMTFSTTFELDRWRLLLIALPMIPLIAHVNLMTATLRGLRRIVLGAISDMLIRPVVFLVAFLFLLFIGRVTVESVILLQILAAFVAVTVGFILLRGVTAEKIKLATIEYNNREWMSVLVPFIGLASVSFLNVEFINIFLGISGTNQDVAIFRTAANMALFVALPLTLIESVVSPYITRLYYAGELGKLQKLTKVVSLAALFASSAPAIILLFYGFEIITLLYGDAYVSAYGTLVVIVIGYMFVNLVGLSMQLLYATEYHASAFRISIYGAFVTVLLCLFLIPLFGVLGAGIVLGFGKALRAGLFVVEARRRLKIKTSLIW